MHWILVSHFQQNLLHQKRTKLTASWIPIGEEENGVTYHAVDEGALLTQYNDSLSQVITSSVKIYESASSKSFKG